MTGNPPWPEFPPMLLTDRTSKDAQAVWEQYLRDARRANGHGPFPALPGVEIVVRHADARDVLGNTTDYAQHFTGSFRGMASLNPNAGADFHALLDEMDASSLINQSGERHRSLRALVGQAFTARRINQARPAIRDLATGLVAAMQPGDDFMAAFALQIPPATLCELIGVPEGERERCTAWVGTLATLLSPLKLLTMDTALSDEVVAAREGLVGYLTALIAERRAQPLDDLVSHLAGHGPPDFDDRALALNLADLLFGGNDNTQRALGQMMLLLLERPDVWEAVAADPDLAVPVVEECLRHRPASPGSFRRTTEATQHGDADWVAGQVLWASAYSANHDEAVFDDGSEFDPGRPNARDHLSFGHGVHYCVGASLARAEMQECLLVLTGALTSLRLSGEIVIANEGAAGPAFLPITFDRRA